MITSFCRHKREFLLPLDYLIPSTLLICPTLEEAQFFRFTFLGEAVIIYLIFGEGKRDDAIQVLEFSRPNVERSVASIGGPVQVVDSQSGVVTFDRVQLV